MERQNVTDLYQASYLLLKGCELESVACIPVGEKLACRLTFSGEDLTCLSHQFYERQAEVNLYAFRQAYNQINSLVHQAKRSLRESGRS